MNTVKRHLLRVADDDKTEVAGLHTFRGYSKKIIPVAVSAFDRVDHAHAPGIDSQFRHFLIDTRRPALRIEIPMNPQIGLKATKKAVTGRPSRSRRIKAAASERRPSRRCISKLKRFSSQWRISQSAGRFSRGPPSFALKRSDHPKRSMGLVSRRHRSRAGSMSSIANARVIRRSPAVATKGDARPSKVSDLGIRPAWMARNTITRVSIHMMSAARTWPDALSASARKRAKVLFPASLSPGFG